jgi:type II secretory pathway pseudopilin PulG
MNITRKHHLSIRLLRSIGGITLVELMVAVVLSGIVISAVFMSWSYLNSHIAIQKRKGFIGEETKRLAHMVAMHTRRSPHVLNWNKNSITVLNPDTKDTLRYTYRDEELLLNDNPLQIRIPNTHVSSFTLSSVDQGNIIHATRHLLLEIEVVVSHTSEHSDTERVLVKTMGPPGSDDTGDSWNF